MKNILHELNAEILSAGVPQACTHEPLAVFEGAPRTTWKGSKVSVVEVPLPFGAVERIQRLHELLHAAYSTPAAMNKYKVPSFVSETIEDVFVHANYWRRQDLTHANNDLEAVIKFEAGDLDEMIKAYFSPIGQLRGDWRLWNEICAKWVRLRAMSGIVLATELTFHEPLEQTVYETFLKHDDRVEHFRFMDSVIEGIVRAVRKGRRKKATEDFIMLLKTPAPSGLPTFDPNAKPFGPLDMAEGEMTKEPLRIEHLPLVQPSSNTSPRFMMARSGPLLNTHRIATAMANKSTHGLFRRRRRLAHMGTVVIDASGSMHFDEETLMKLCNAAPGATVAYYAGHSKPWGPKGHWGTLFIYAQHGLRSNMAPRRHGDNDVDLFALRWLLDQPGPRFFVSDNGFCGGPEGQAEQAHILVRAAAARGDLKYIETREVSEILTQFAS